MTNTSQAKMDFRETKAFHYRSVFSLVFLLLRRLTFFSVLIKKNNVEWLENNTKIRYSVERIFTRDGKFEEKILNQEGAFVDILRVVRF